ncbi:MAG: DUF2752 domain-containing protein [Paludibacteraceae bacterium]|nr:DUF2752 domain-containing protein [Paludibacteraceae bacterium]
MDTISLLPCAYKQLFGISCPLCGFQRSMLLLHKGEVWESICQFPIWLIMLLWVICFIAFVLAGKRKLFLSNSWSWTILLISLFANAIYQNLFW